MTIFATGFIFIMIFTLLIGITAIIFISFDAKGTERTPDSIQKTTPHLFAVVREVNTGTIETVDWQGTVQQWECSS